MTALAIKIRGSKGISLVEMMVAITLGLMLTAGVITIFLSSKATYTGNERYARMQENGRYALHLLVEDLRHAGYWGMVTDTANITVTAGLTPTDNSKCGVWAATLSDPIKGLNAATNPNASYPCISNSSYKSGTDALAIKRTQSASASLTTNNVYLRTNASNGVLFRYTDASSIPTTVTGTTTWDWEYTPRIYYIRPNGNNIPSLYREKLEANAPLEMSAEELVEGIEDLNIMYGIDSLGNDGVADAYVSAPPATQWTQVVSAKIYVLARELEPDYAFTNDNSYSLGDKTVTVNDNYHRAVFSTTVIIHNLRNMANFR